MEFAKLYKHQKGTDWANVWQCSRHGVSIEETSIPPTGSSASAGRSRRARPAATVPSLPLVQRSQRSIGLGDPEGMTSITIDEIGAQWRLHSSGRPHCASAPTGSSIIENLPSWLDPVSDGS